MAHNAAKAHRACPSSPKGGVPFGPVIWATCTGGSSESRFKTHALQKHLATFASRFEEHSQGQAIRGFLGHSCQIQAE